MEKIILFLALACSAACVIRVVKPEALREKHKNITYSLARFGELDYRLQTNFEVQLAANSLGCTFIDPIKEGSHKVALLLDRGECSFSKKSSNGFIVVESHPGRRFAGHRGKEKCGRKRRQLHPGARRESDQVQRAADRHRLRGRTGAAAGAAEEPEGRPVGGLRRGTLGSGRSPSPLPRSSPTGCTRATGQATPA